MTPRELVGAFADHGRIMGSTSTFGAPFYRDRVLGQLAYGPSLTGKNFCSEEDYDIPPPKTQRAAGGQDKVRLINIVIVRRGNCSFTTKVKIAQAKGAHAVIIVDREDSDYTSRDLANIIVADDGYGDVIHIPSVLISKEDGRRLIEAAQRSQVVVELAWDLPTDHVVTVDMWMSSASIASMKFIKEFAPKRRALNEVMIFNPHYAVFSMDQGNPAVYSGVCLDNQPKFCAEDPDGGGDITGKDVLEEDVRQLCIHDKTKKSRTSLDDLVKGKASVEYAAEYWDYMEKFPDRCPLDGSGKAKFGLECSLQVMKEVGIDTAEIQACATAERDARLSHELENPAWSPRALRINGWRYSGMLTADLVVRAVCSGFIHEPRECSDLITARDVFRPYIPVPSGGVSLGELLGWLLATISLGFVCMLMYKRYLKKEMRTTLREEVMLEVQAQMGEYAQLRGA
ncbi:unnamed protein product [Effrenium voratum]|nr:unnamed protein product [Effrenium voratum]CAJ1372860.1 unnamed protein product [Effrenium voratum]